jgi:hypothetical protein
MRCYNYGKFGHKYQNCRKSRSLPMKNTPYNSGRKTNEVWNLRGKDKSQRKNLERKGPKSRVPH